MKGANAMTTLKRSSKGFTLIEVLISIVMVGILFLPLLSVFSKGMGANNVSKNIQRANAVAASVAEQVRAYDTFEDMCNVGVTGTNNLVLTSSNGGVYSFALSGLVSDGKDYTADIKVDYNAYKELNDKGLPQITSLGSGSTAMAYEELNCTDTVISEYQSRYKQDSGNDINSNKVAEALKKSIVVDVTDTQLDASGKNMIPEGNVHISVYTKYTIDASKTSDSTLKGYAGESAKREKVLYDENVVLSKLKGIYIFYSYDLANGTNIFQGINFNMNLQQNSSKDDLHNIILYSLCQSIDDVMTSSEKLTGDDIYNTAKEKNYRIEVEIDGAVPSGKVSDYVSVFSNFPAKVGTDLQEANKMDNIVSSVPINRLAKVSISIKKDGKECATLETTRGE